MMMMMGGYFKTSFLCADLESVLEFTVESRLASNLQRSEHLLLPEAPIKGLLLKITFIYLFCVWSDLRVPTCEGQVTTNRNQLSPPTMWLPRIKLRSQGLVASTVAHRALSPAPTPSLLGHLRRSPSRGSESRPWSGESVTQEQEAC